METTAPPRMLALVRAARHIIEGNREAGVAALDEVVATFTDPEPLFYMVRQYASLGEVRLALDTLELVCAAGYCPYPSLARDPSFVSLRDEPEFTQILNRLRDVHESIVGAFQKAGGPAILGDSAL